MINFYRYDNIQNEINKNKTWINKSTQSLLSREIKYHKYYLLTKRYNKNNEYNYYIILSDELPENVKGYKTIRDNYGRIKIRLYNLYYECNFNLLKNDCNIEIIHEEGDEDSDVYKIIF